ncbi:MAG: septum formation initiator family protein [Lentisphaerae bacterium]|nr:septum formation initiator family protein [Lentisphaerota bacterium]
MNKWGTIYRSAWALLIVLFVIGLVGIFLPKCHRLRQLQQRKAELQADNRKTEELTRALLSKQERFSTDPAYIERVARETGMVRPDEIIFQYTNPPSHSSPPQRTTP